MIELIQRKTKKKLSRNIMHLFTLIFLGKTNVNFRSEGCAQGSCLYYILTPFIAKSNAFLHFYRKI